MVYYKIVADGKSIDVEAFNFLKAKDMARGYSALSGQMASIYDSKGDLVAMINGKLTASKMWDGWEISEQREFGNDSRHGFLMKVYRGQLVWCDDYTYSKHYTSIDTVKKILTRS